MGPGKKKGNRRVGGLQWQVSRLKQEGGLSLGTCIMAVSSFLHFQKSLSQLFCPGPYQNHNKELGASFSTARQLGAEKDKVEVEETLLPLKGEI